MGPLTMMRGDGEARAAQNAVQREARVERGLERGEQDGHVLRFAAREHGVDRHLLDCARGVVRRHGAHHVVRGPGRARQHAQDPFRGWGDDRKSVRPSAVEARFRIVRMRGQGHLTCPEAGFAEARPQPLVRTGFDREGAAAGPERGQFRAQVRSRRQVAPLFTVPPYRAARLLPVLESEQRRNGVDLKKKRVLEVRVIDDAWHRSREARIVLAQHGERGAVVRQPLQYRLDELTGRAISLDDDGETRLRERRVCHP